MNILRGRPKPVVVVAFLCVIIFFPSILKAQKINGPIVLTNRQLAEKVKEFYIADVIDDRSERQLIAWLLPTLPPFTKYKIDVKDGASEALKRFADYAIPADKNLRPVNIRIKKLRLIEEQKGTDQVSGKLELELLFELKKDYGSVKLITYPASTSYTRSVSQQYAIGILISRAFEGGLNWFNNWMNREADTNIKLAKSIKLIFTDYTEKPEGDTIYYSPKRPLTWDDFKDKPYGNKYVAEVLPGFGYTEQAEVQKGVVLIRISMRVFLPKSAAWVRSEGRNSTALNHEQRHFDIAKIAARHFQQALLSMKIPADNYDGYINVQYLDSYREMNQLQDNYDKETNHGVNGAAQQRWDARIDKELKELL
ncbi:DUF922 domain-containing protein [Mucilaginibacter celer]|uniref:DUF922 domain-containing protein n=1 Tax=Mucilaginibacter celer TaxID=2305508 RepID=A0A494VRW0_9SPHI|nr:DUF922 domain-containing protein [Mucilaginibacter celer]AYL94073.1 DUF922 domain-containing protein [Mucilaginibacter celer]